MISFIVSGQPKMGHESWPLPVDDKVLSDRLYGQRGATDRTRMEIKFEKIGDRLITYYHFSKLKDVTSCLTDEEKKMNPPADHGRKGSFFVMSLRMDGCYSTDFPRIYTLLEEMYENHVNGKVLKMSKEGYLVYQIMKLEDVKEIWESITSELEARGEKTFLKQTKPISSDISIKRTRTSDYFSVEDAEKDIESVLIRKGGVFVLSSDEMKARNERIKQQEIKSDENNHSGERKTQHEFDAFVKTTKDVQALASTTDNSMLEKLTSLSEEQEYISGRINDLGDHFPLSIQKKALNIRKWLPIALIVLGIINVYLLVSFIGTNREVNSLVEKIDSLTEQIDSLKCYLPSTSEVTNTVPDKTVVLEEDAEITLLDLVEKKGDISIDVTNNTMEQGVTYIVTAKTGESGSRKEAKGNGNFSCDIGSNQDIYIQQKGNACTITIVNATVREITLTYNYKYQNESKSFPRLIKISQ